MIMFDNVSLVLSSGRLRTLVLDETTMNLPSNERLAILGHPGSGKTSFIRLLAGSLLPTTGSVSRHARISFPVGFTGGYRTKLTVRENIEHAARLYGADVDEVVDFVSHVAGIEHLMPENFGDIPAQIRTRLAFAVSYAIPFDTYLIDNRVGVGDDEFRAKCERMFELRAEESGFILTSSLSRYAKRFCNRGAILHQGSLTMYDDFDKACWDFDRLDRGNEVTSTAEAETSPA